MKKELELKLVEKYPKILADYGGDKMLTCMHWGVECGDGWYELLDKGMEKIQHICDMTSDNMQLKASQIKEKYGTLRFYYIIENGSEVQNEILDDLVEIMELKSSRICENTGKHGEPCVFAGWYKTLCYAEARKQKYRAVNDSTEAYWKTLDAKQNPAEETSEDEEIKI
jgi:hypothetical protein